MSNQFEKLKNKLCLKVCLKSKKASPDYEYVSYTQQDTNKVTTTGDNKEMKTIPKSKRENPQFHSTQIETSMNSLYKTALNNTLTIEQNKITSTLIQSIQPFQTEEYDNEPELSQIIEEEQDSNAFSNIYYTSPIISRSMQSSSSSANSSLSVSSALFTDATDNSFDQSQSFECDTKQFKSATSTFFRSINNDSSDQLHVCVLAYEAKFEGDLSIDFAERVKILHNVNNEYSLVKNIITNKCGYVPNECLSSLNEFLAEIARNCHNF